MTGLSAVFRCSTGGGSGFGNAYMKLHEFRCHFREVGRATVPAKPVGTVADPTLVHKQSFFFDQTGRFSGRGGARMKLNEFEKRTAEPKNVE